MKEKYTKPCLIVEEFRLSQSVAQNCGELNREPGTIFGHTSGSPESCSFGMGDGFYLFGNSKCNMPYDESVVSLFCYNNPAGAFPIFGS